MLLRAGLSHGGGVGQGVGEGAHEDGHEATKPGGLAGPRGGGGGGGQEEEGFRPAQELQGHAEGRE